MPEYLNGEAGLSGHPDWDFYTKQLGVGAAYTEIPFIDEFGNEFLSRGVIIRCIAGDLEWSWDGVRLDGELTATATVTFDQKHKRKIYIRRSGAGPCDMQLWAW